MLYRIERDSLGEVRVPANAYYGAQTQRAIENFPVSGMKPYRAFVWSMVAIKRAAAEVNRDLGLLDPTIANAIIQAADECLGGALADQWVVDPFQAGAGTSHNMNTNEVLANRASEILGVPLTAEKKPVHPNDHVNMSQSTNDTIPTAIRLGVLWRLPELQEVVQGLIDALWAKAREFDPIVKSGRTHLQDAVPIRLGQEFSGYARAVERDLERINRAADMLRRMPIGGTAVGTGLNAHPEYHRRMVQALSRILGQPLYESDNLFEGMQSMADAADFSAALRTLAITLTRIANDLRLLSSGPTTGLDEIRLPPVQPGSSIMPGKVNPVLAEMLNMAMFHVQGCDLTVSLAAQAGQLELNVMMPIIAHNLNEMMHVMIGAIRAFTTKCVVGIQAQPEKARGWLARNPIIVTALNPIIGYMAGAELVKEAMRRNVTIREVAAERIAAGTLTKKDGSLLTLEEVDQVLADLYRLTEGGLGGPAGGG
ncbi:MAG: aspartate ammonia-lyase [Thermoflexales bacterium]|nr:aspartate ammonia-lyase [Thermoflexales bacterium]MCS7325379.1 aspartate ammonia-lyase [Thermoflexales bacterium]MCX7938203.1 aspartate ammonia-lyase [Thermoflexales bacterium]MDW8053001.1 aspartate ammonia-lyase [Anaerolineae bacterium]MDW8291654.1 aspartate ammonia-lyase [Anaerolineae bacterium]